MWLWLCELESIRISIQLRKIKKNGKNTNCCINRMGRCTINGSIITIFFRKTVFVWWSIWKILTIFFSFNTKFLLFLGCVFDTLHLLCVANVWILSVSTWFFVFFFSFIKSYILLLFSRMFYLTGATVCSRQLNYFALCTCACIKILLLWHSLAVNINIYINIKTTINHCVNIVLSSF